MLGSGYTLMLVLPEAQPDSRVHAYSITMNVPEPDGMQASTGVLEVEHPVGRPDHAQLMGMPPEYVAENDTPCPTSTVEGEALTVRTVNASVVRDDEPCPPLFAAAAPSPAEDRTAGAMAAARTIDRPTMIALVRTRYVHDPLRMGFEALSNNLMVVIPGRQLSMGVPYNNRSEQIGINGPISSPKGPHQIRWL
jgi:hypothetical protein